jgi:hypothetical protein
MDIFPGVLKAPLAEHLACQVDAALFIKLGGRGMAENMRVEIPGEGMSTRKAGIPLTG